MNINKQQAFKALLSPEEIRKLSRLIGHKFYIIYSPSLSVEGNVITAPSFSISFKNSWINFTNAWLETPNDIGYYKLEIDSADNPLGIKFSKEKNMFINPVSSYLFNRGLEHQEIERIEIYSKNEAWDDEDIMYDFSLIFYMGNGVNICINVLEDITDQLECTSSTERIQDLINNCELRMVLTKNIAG